MVFQRSKHFFDHSMSRFAANPKLALRAQTLNLRTLHFELTGGASRKPRNVGGVKGRNNERQFPYREVPPRAGTSMVSEKILIRLLKTIFFSLSKV